MNSIYLNGIGLVSRAGNSPESVIKSILFPEEVPPQALSYESFFDKSELRRISRYAKLAAEVSARCIEDAGKDICSICDESTGIIFTAGYGAAESNIKFFKSAAKKEPDLCNPLTFASMVPNYALGTVCILLKIKGYSTALLGGNPFDLAFPVINQKKVSSMIIGAEEEYCPEIFEAAEHNRTSHTVQLAEGNIAFFVSAEPMKNCCAEMIYSKSYALSLSPILHKAVEFPEIDTCFPEVPDLIFGIGEQLPFGQTEKKLFEKYFPDIPYSSISRSVFGETMGSSFLLNIACAAICLRHRVAPVDEKKQTILVTGTDIQGNYMQVMLKKTEMESHHG